MITPESLIFLISQPRSGSTLTQKILSEHSDIYTRSEPWIMLHPAYSLKRTGIWSEYDTLVEKNAFEDFVSNIPDGGKSVYISKIQECYLSLYEKYLNHYNKKFFLDKTPRYYLIYDELRSIFPSSKFILLQRNPLAVLGSIINSWTEENWDKLSSYRNDLIEAIDAIIKIKKQNIPNQFVITYEELVLYPEKKMKSVCDFIGIEYGVDILRYGENENIEWKLGDHDFVNDTNTVDNKRIDNWVNGLVEPQYWRVIYDYLIYIGEERFDTLGYDYQHYHKILKDNMPCGSVEEIKNKTLGLSFLLYGINDDINNLKNLSILNNESLEAQLKLKQILNSKKYKIILILERPLVWLLNILKRVKKG